MPATDMSTVIQLVHSEAAGLADFLAGLDEAGWSASSACAGWLVGDVTAHLAQASNTWADSVTRAVAGDSGPPPGQQPLQPGERGSETTARAAIQARESRGREELLQTFRDGYGRLDGVLSGLSPEDWERPCYHRRGVVPVGVFVSRRVQELAIHGWDIRSPFDASAALSPGAVAVVSSLVPLWLNAAFGTGPGVPTPLRYRFRVSGAVPLARDVVVGQDGFSVEDSGEAPADVEFRLGGTDYILLIYGRLDLDKALAAGTLAIEGDLQQAKRFMTIFRGV